MADRVPVHSLITSTQELADGILVSVAGEIDLQHSPELRASLFHLVEEGRPKRMVIDLGSVTYMDSSAIAVMVELLRQLKQIGGKLVLACPQKRVRGMMEIARLTRIFALVDSLEEAKAI